MLELIPFSTFRLGRNLKTRLSIGRRTLDLRLEYRFFICNFFEEFEEVTDNPFIFIRLVGYGEFGCGRRPR